MPVTLTIAADTAQEVRNEMRALLGNDAVAAPAAEPETKTTRKPAKAKAEEPGKSSAPAENGATTADADQPDASGTSSTQTDEANELTEKSLKARAMSFSQKGGPSALVEMQKLAGAPNGRISEIVGDEGKGLEPDMERMKKLDALLTEAGY